MSPKDEGAKLVCESCGWEKGDTSGMVQTEKRKETVGDVAVQTGEKNLPKTKAKCEECGNGEAYYTIEQTRAADEPPTRIYSCTKCRHTWREYG